jgi:hypothetical protein
VSPTLVQLVMSPDIWIFTSGEGFRITMNLGCWKHSAAQHSSSQPLRLMPDITQQSSTLQIETLTSSSTFWGGLSGSLQLVNSGELMVEPWTFSFRSKYSDFDFYQADETAVLNEDGSYTITISAPSGSAGLAVGDSLPLNFTVNNASDPDVTLAEVVLSDFSTEAGDNSTDAGDNSIDTSTGNLITQLAPQRAARGNRVVHKYQPGHGAQQHPVSERPLAAKLSAALRHRGVR